MLQLTPGTKEMLYLGFHGGGAAPESQYSTPSNLNISTKFIRQQMPIGSGARYAEKCSLPASPKLEIRTVWLP